MTRSRSWARLVLAVSLPLAGCSATHLSLGFEDAARRGDGAVPPGTDVGPIGLDAGTPMGIDAARTPPGVDAWTPTPSDPDAWTPSPTDPDAWSPPTGAADAWTPTPGTDAGPPVGTDAGPPGVACGSEVCVDPEICCISFSGGPGGGGMSSMACGAPADCMGLAAACDGPEDCAAGEACCGMRSTGGAATGCVPDAMCRFGRLCHVDTDCTGRDTCCEFMGRSVCSPFCP